MAVPSQWRPTCSPTYQPNLFTPAMTALLEVGVGWEKRERSHRKKFLSGFSQTYYLTLWSKLHTTCRLTSQSAVIARSVSDAAIHFYLELLLGFTQATILLFLFPQSPSHLITQSPIRYHSPIRYIIAQIGQSDQIIIFGIKLSDHWAFRKGS